MNTIFDKLVKSKIEKFIDDYKNLSRQIFVNEEGKLIHPGEFGVYRERIIKSLLQPFLPARLAIGSGFIITSQNNISTQCDLLIYDKENTPVIENEEQRFFPIECVAGVIEVKSSLTKSQLAEALIKLSNIKKLRNDIKSNTYIFKSINAFPNFDTKLNIRDQIATFLICEKFEFDIKDHINSFFKDTYSDIDKSLYHNIILSLQDGCCMYFSGERLIYYPYFDYQKDAFINSFVLPHPFGYFAEHILIFINYFFMIISDVSILYQEITTYLGETRPKMVIHENRNPNA